MKLPVISLLCGCNQCPARMVILNVVEDDRFKHNPLVAYSPHIRFYAGAPLLLDRTKKLGT